jgi:hypothetical protein
LLDPKKKSVNTEHETMVGGSMSTGQTLARSDIDEVCREYDGVHLIISPPRTSSTALARVFLEHRSVGAYCHEPFDRHYHHREGLESVFHSLSDPLRKGSGRRLVIKEMTFQLGKHLRELRWITGYPIVFLIRDPRLSIASRMAKRVEGGQDAEFKAIESGWDDLSEQVSFCDMAEVPYIILDSTDLRNDPQSTLSRLLPRFELEFRPEMLNWTPLNVERFGRLSGTQDHWYRRVLESKALEPAVEKVPDLESFSDAMRDQVERALELYLALRRNPHFLDLSS